MFADSVSVCRPLLSPSCIDYRILLLTGTRQHLSALIALPRSLLNWSRSWWQRPNPIKLIFSSRFFRLGSLCLCSGFSAAITDTVIACTISRAVAQSYSVLLLPPITISCSHEHSAWPGTISISAQTLYSLVADIYESVTRAGPRALIIVNGHGGNYVLSNIVQEASAIGRRMALFPTRDDWDAAQASADLTSSMHEDMHAGEAETSILLYSAPDLVRDGYETADHVSDNRRHMLTVGLHEYTESGVIGRPSLATAEKGKTILDSFVSDFGDLLGLFELD
jgi:creatinine amidohydrolase